MSDYVEYIKGGDILLAPSLGYKHQYVLKCGLCEDYYGEFELFLSHYLYHCDMELENNEDVTIMNEPELDVDIIVDEYDDDVVESGINYAPMVKSKHQAELEEQDTKTSFNEELVGHEDTNYSVSFPEEVDEHCSATENITETLDVHNEQLEETSIDKLTAADKSVVHEKSNTEYVRNFVRCKENLASLINAYKNEAHLWNFSLPVKYRRKAKRCVTWSKMAKHLKSSRGIEISSNEVAACLIYLRQKYRERKRNGDLMSKNNNEVLPTWAFKQLHFLNAFVESKPVALLDIHQDLSPKQTNHLINIFQRCTHLWDTNTLEYHCSNKRNEAFKEMKKIIEEELDLEVEESALRNYLQSVRDYIVEVKRRKLGIARVDPEKVKCHAHLMFLYDHVGPFKCSHCRRTILTPLALKAHESEHDGTIPFKCSLCDKDIKAVETYLFHIRRHMGDLNYECTECGKKFLRLYDLKEHTRCHTGDKPFCCEICGASFRHRTGFGMHMKRHGKNYISFCPYCSKGFYSKDSMQMHSKVHTNERDFVCPTCGKAFKTRKTLKSHVAIHENGHHVCTLCGKAFKNRINLWQHTRKHRINSVAHVATELLSPFDEN